MATARMFPAGEFPLQDGKLMVKPWEEGAIKVIRKARFLLYLFTFTLEIVGYFIFFQNQWDLPYTKLHQEVLVRNVAS
jgi:hypothetical protein